MQEKSVNKVVGLLGGSFNPPHDGHIHIAKTAYQNLSIDEVWLLVTPQSPHKQACEYISLEHRVKMCELASGDFPWIIVKDLEKDLPTNRTADTLGHLKQNYKNIRFVWIMGDDAFVNFHKWDRVKYEIDGEPVPDWKYIINNNLLAVVNRADDVVSVFGSTAGLYAEHMYCKDKSVFCNNANGWILINEPAVDVSSTSIKKKLKDEVVGISGIDLSVEEYIYKNSLHKKLT